MDDLILIRDAIIKSKINLNKYSNKTFWTGMLSFSLFSAMSDFIDYMDNNKIVFIHKDENEWNIFLKKYYNMKNKSINNFLNIIDSDDKEFNYEQIKEDIFWIFDIINNIYNDKNKPYAFDGLLAGLFYNRIFYYLKEVQSYCEQELGLNNRLKETNNHILSIKNEKELIIYNQKIITENKIENISNEIEKQIAGMWLRMVDFVQNEIPKEKEIMNGNIEWKCDYI